MSKVDIDELVHWRDTCEALAASLQRKVRHCDEITEERDKAVRERDEALAEVKTWKHDWYVAKADLGTAMRLADVALRDVAEKNERALRERDQAREEVEQLRYKAIQYDLDRAGIESRAQEAVALVEARAEVQEYREQLRKLPDANRVASQDAYRRGAEAMRLACQEWCIAWENDGEAIADALADLRVEDKP